MYRIEGGIPPLVELLDFTDAKVQRAAAGALRTLAFKNDENKNQVGGFSWGFSFHGVCLDFDLFFYTILCRLLNAMLFLPSF